MMHDCLVFAQPYDEFELKLRGFKLDSGFLVPQNRFFAGSTCVGRFLARVHDSVYEQYKKNPMAGVSVVFL